MSLIKNLIFTALLIQGASSFYTASEKKNKVIIKEINMATYSQLMGVK